MKWWEGRNFSRICSSYVASRWDFFQLDTMVCKLIPKKWLVAHKNKNIWILSNTYGLLLEGKKNKIKNPQFHILPCAKLYKQKNCSQGFSYHSRTKFIWRSSFIEFAHTPQIIVSSATIKKNYVNPLSLCIYQLLFSYFQSLVYMLNFLQSLVWIPGFVVIH